MGVNIPESVASIEGGAFANCESLESVRIPEGVENIENFEFSECRKLTAVSIGGYAFSGCRNLTCVEIPKRAVVIADDAFKGCGRKLTIYGKKDRMLRNWQEVGTISL